jgi:hypothetical protein
VKVTAGNAPPDPLGQRHIRLPCLVGSDARCFVGQLDGHRGRGWHRSTAQCYSQLTFHERKN